VSTGESIQQAAALLRQASRVAVFAGAGLSAESGLPTFRDQGGLWEGHQVEDVATPEGFERDPLLVWRFYAQRQADQTRVGPNPGHYGLAEMEDVFDDFLLITQNVDNLSERAGSRKIVKIHGDLLGIRCSRCDWSDARSEPIDAAGLRSAADLPRCPAPGCGALARPTVVWFGEMLPLQEIRSASEFCASADVLISVGTSGLVSGGYGFADAVKARGGSVIEVNPNQTHLSTLADVAVRMGSARALPQILQLIRGEAIL